MPLRPRQCLSQLEVYTPGKSIAEVKAAVKTDLPILKMASNENPLGAGLNWQDLELSFARAHQYPHIPTSGLISALSTYWGLSSEHFVLGNGSDEVILFLAQTFLNPGDHVLTSNCTFSEYQFVTTLMNAHLFEVPLTPNWAHNLSGYLAAITPQTKLIFLANPNNPTGTFISHAELVQFLDQVPDSICVVLDEAYAEYATHPDFPNSKQLIETYPNVVVLRTFSKLYGLAGLRIGYGIAQPSTIALLVKTQPPFNINCIALEAARLALQNTEHRNATLALTQQGRLELERACLEMGLITLPSQTNFICVFVPKPAKEIYGILLEQGLIIRTLDSFGLPQAIRITIGLPEHHARLIPALKLALT